MPEYSDETREFYTHDNNCSGTNFTPMNARGIRTCLDCGGQFDVEGKGVRVQDARFDENYEEKVAEGIVPPPPEVT